jgi:transposase
MAKRRSEPKMVELKRTRTLHPHPEAVADPLFEQNPFFDARDLLQVRYEMLRRHRVEGMPIRRVAMAFGVSRPTFYQTQAAFHHAGLAGLIPQPRGPKEAHKLSPEVLDYVAALQTAKPGMTTGQCVQAVRDRFGITIHRRSLERARARRKKKPPPKR